MSRMVVAVIRLKMSGFMVVLFLPDQKIVE